MTSMRLKPLDAIWLMMESHDTPMHVGVLAIFQVPNRAGSDYLLELASAMRETGTPVAPWNCLLANKRNTSMTPALVEERDFDLDYHFRHCALPKPGGERELGIEVSRLHSQELDRGRPLWELHLFEGLERNRFAFYLKIHHALIDNVNGIPLMLSLLSDSARHRKAPPLWTVQPPTAEVVEESGPGNMAQAMDSLGSIGKASSGFLRSVLNRAGKAVSWRQLARPAPPSTATLMPSAALPRSSLTEHASNNWPLRQTVHSTRS